MIHDAMKFVLNLVLGAFKENLLNKDLIDDSAKGSQFFHIMLTWRQIPTMHLII